MLAILAGIPHYSDFSALINRPVVVASALNVQRLHRIAELVVFPAEAIFLDGEDQAFTEIPDVPSEARS